jgi:hypothetical protein
LSIGGVGRRESGSIINRYGLGCKTVILGIYIFNVIKFCRSGWMGCTALIAQAVRAYLVLTLAQRAWLFRQPAPAPAPAPAPLTLTHAHSLHRALASSLPPSRSHQGGVKLLLAD